MQVDRHDEQVDSGVEEHVGQRPRHAVHVVLAGDMNGCLKHLLELFLPVEEPSQACTVDARAAVPAERRYADPSLLMQRSEPLDLIRRGAR